MVTLQRVRGRARMALGQGDPGRALSLVERIHQHFPADLQAAVLLGQIQLELGCPDEARNAFEGVLEVDPENVMARCGLAILAEEGGDLDRALEQFQRAFDLDSSNGEVAEEIARLHSRLSHTRPADPGSSQHGMARHLLREQRYERAIPLFEEALRGAPESVEIGLGLAQALWLSGRFEDAEEVAEGILTRRPGCLKALALVAGASFSRGDWRALALLQETAAMDPENSAARRLFVGAGLPFPKVAAEPELAGADLAELLAPAAPPSIPPAEGEAELEPMDEWEGEGAGGEGLESFDLPQLPSEGEWVRRRREAIHQGSEMGDWAARWRAADALVKGGQFLRAVEEYLAVMRGVSEDNLEGDRFARNEMSLVEKEKDGENPGNREA